MRVASAGVGSESLQKGNWHKLEGRDIKPIVITCRARASSPMYSQRSACTPQGAGRQAYMSKGRQKVPQSRRLRSGTRSGGRTSRAFSLRPPLDDLSRWPSAVPSEAEEASWEGWVPAVGGGSHPMAFCFVL